MPFPHSGFGFGDCVGEVLGAGTEDGEKDVYEGHVGIGEGGPETVCDWREVGFGCYLFEMKGRGFGGWKRTHD